MDNTVYIFTDGACSGNPGPGGWGAVLRYQEHEREISGGADHTTNNRMELMAAIQSLKTLTRGCDVVISTDSQYVKNGITEWIHNWKKNNWKTSARKAVKNADLWMMLDEECSKHDITWEWVRGHNGHPENERADQLATGAIKF